MSEQCGTCRFWDEFDDGEGVADATGHCLRHAPQPRAFCTESVINTSFTEADKRQWLEIGFVLWPVTKCGQWCGEWQPQEPQP